MIDHRPLIVHVVYSFDTGGLENGIVNLINRMSPQVFRHAIVALTNCSPQFCDRITRDDVHFIAMNKAPGHALKLYPALHRLFKDLKPAIVHTRNLAALETVIPARTAGVPVRIHGEHGWDVSDPEGNSHRYRIARRLYRPFVSHYVALSGHIEKYLVNAIGVPRDRISRICNGVDTDRFHPTETGRGLLPGSPLNESGLRVIGTVGRLQAIKDQRNLIRAFALLLERMPASADDLRLMVVGNGPLRREIEAEMLRLGVTDKVWLAGERADIPEVLRSMDIFVLPSRAEGISNTVLEAMASGLPVVATDVGGSSELVVSSRTGILVPARDPDLLADALAAYLTDPAQASAHGRAGRDRVQAEFSLDGMVARYTELYESKMAEAGLTRPAQPVLS